MFQVFAVAAAFEEAGVVVERHETNYFLHAEEPGGPTGGLPANTGRTTLVSDRLLERMIRRFGLDGDAFRARCEHFQRRGHLITSSLVPALSLMRESDDEDN